MLGIRKSCWATSGPWELCCCSRQLPGRSLLGRPPCSWCRVCPGFQGCAETSSVHGLGDGRRAAQTRVDGLPAAQWAKSDHTSLEQLHMTHNCLVIWFWDLSSQCWLVFGFVQELMRAQKQQNSIQQWILWINSIFLWGLLWRVQCILVWTVLLFLNRLFGRFCLYCLVVGRTPVEKSQTS